MKRKAKIIVFDCETERFEENNGKPIEFRFACFYDGQTYKIIKGREAFDKYIQELALGKENVILIAHNLMFDFSYCILPLLKAGLIIKPVENGGKLLFAKAGKEVKRKIKKKDGTEEIRDGFESWIEFRDSFALFQCSLKELGKSVGLDKIEHNKQWKEELSEADIEYCKRDCEIVYLALQKFKDFLSNELHEQVEMQDIPPTTASCSWKLFKFHNTRIRISKKTGREEKVCDYILKNEPINDMFLKKFYSGGRVELFNMELAKHVSYNDINSLYPFVMITNGFHKPPYFIKDYAEKLDENNPKTIGFFALIDESKEQYPLIPIHYESGLYFPACKKQTFIFIEEYEYLKKRGIPMELKATLYASSKPEKVFSYLERFYEMKKKKDSLSYFYKILMNATYGRFGIDLEKDNIRIIPIEQADLTQPEIEIIDLNLPYVKFHKKEEIRFERNLVIACKITALARLEITKAIHKLTENGIKVYYCDTDSIVCEKNDILDYGKELGQFKEEHVFEWFQALGNKEYIARINESDYLLKLKGVHTDNLQALFDYHSDGVKQLNVSKIKTMIRNGWLDLPRNMLLIKKSQTTYHKREILKDYSTKPLKGFSELKKIEEENGKRLAERIQTLKVLLLEEKVV